MPACPSLLAVQKKERRNYKSAQDTLLGKMFFFFLTLMYMKKKYKYVEDFCGIK